MQFQADLLRVPISRPEVIETTALGAAMLAGLGAGIFPDLHRLRAVWKEQRRFTPGMADDERHAHPFEVVPGHAQHDQGCGDDAHFCQPRFLKIHHQHAPADGLASVAEFKRATPVADATQKPY